MTSNSDNPLVVAPDALFFLAMNGETFGPYKVEEVWGFLEAQQILPEHLVWTDGMETWCEIGALFDLDAMIERSRLPIASAIVTSDAEESALSESRALQDEIEIAPARRGTLFARLGVATTAAIFLHLGLLVSVTFGAPYIFRETREEPIAPSAPEPSIDVALVTVEDTPPPPPVAETPPPLPPPDPPPPPAIPDVPLPTPPAPAPVVNTSPPPVPTPPIPEPLPPPVEPPPLPPEPAKPVVHHATEPPAPAPVPQVVDASPSDYLDSPAPRYPYEARRMRQEGTVILRVSVDDSGSPNGVWIDQSSGFPVLDQAAQKQVAGFFRFKVGSARVLRVPIAFQL